MQPIPDSDLMDAYQSVKELADRLKRVFDKVDDEAILNGKAIPLTRLLHGVLRTQLQLIEKMIRRRNAMESGGANKKREARNHAARTKPSSLEPANTGMRPLNPPNVPSYNKTIQIEAPGKETHPAPGLLMR